jgi:sulfite exporter TauE/SafE
LITYASLGAAAGLLGGKLGALSGASELAAALICAWFLFQAVSVYLPSKPTKIGERSGIMQRFVNISASLFDRPFLFGLTAGFLPCGWLYSNVLLAAAVGDPFQSSLLMTAFWLGTIPALQSVVLTSKLLKKFLPTKSRFALSTFYVLFALLSVYLHLSNTSNNDATSCHKHPQSNL